ncbi:hypothetical protein [Spirosoma fluminis]
MDSGQCTLNVTEHGGNGKPTKGTLSGVFYYGTSPVPVQVKFKSAPVYYHNVASKRRTRSLSTAFV